MSFKKHNWMSYGRLGDMIKIEITDNTGRKIDFFQTNNNKDYAKIIKIIKEKYGFSPEISFNKEEEIKKEQDWLKKDMEW